MRGRDCPPPPPPPRPAGTRSCPPPPPPAAAPGDTAATVPRCLRRAPLLPSPPLPRWASAEKESALKAAGMGPKSEPGWRCPVPVFPHHRGTARVVARDPPPRPALEAFSVPNGGTCHPGGDAGHPGPFGTFPGPLGRGSGTCRCSAGPAGPVPRGESKGKGEKKEGKKNRGKLEEERETWKRREERGGEE